CNIILDRAQIVPQMLSSRWPCSRKHASFFRHSISSIRRWSSRLFLQQLNCWRNRRTETPTLSNNFLFTCYPLVSIRASPYSTNGVLFYNQFPHHPQHLSRLGM